VVAVNTYRDAGFLPHAYVNFLCLLGWSPKDDREQMSRDELVTAFSLEGVNRANATVNFTGEDPLDPKALWLNSQHIYSMSVEDLSERLLPFVRAAGYEVELERVRQVTPLIRERIRLLSDAPKVGDFFFSAQLPPYPLEELIPQKGDLEMAERVLRHALEVLEKAEFTHSALEGVLRQAATGLQVKTGQMFLPIRVAVCGRKNAPPLFETLEVVGREVVLQRIREAVARLQPATA
jgi:glutamyl-tRNA synthetase